MEGRSIFKCGLHEQLTTEFEQRKKIRGASRSQRYRTKPENRLLRGAAAGCLGDSVPLHFHTVKFHGSTRMRLTETIFSVTVPMRDQIVARMEDRAYKHYGYFYCCGIMRPISRS